MKKLSFFSVIFFLCLYANAQVDVLHYGINLDVDNMISKHHIGYTDIKALGLQDNNVVSFMLKNHKHHDIIF